MTNLPHISAADLNEFIEDLLENGGFNDLYFSTGYRAMARIQGRIMPISANALDVYVVESIAKRLFGDSITGRLAKGEDDDGAYSIADKSERGKRFYFRTNVQSSQALGGGRGMTICIRAIDQVPPPLDVLEIQDTIVNNFFPPSGLVIVSGPTGSGKSTSVASMMTEHMQHRQRNQVVQTIESPVEYRYDHLEHEHNVLFQSSVGEFKADLKSFQQGVRGTLRRGTDGTVVGEMRDLETIEAALIAANTGQTVWGTIHCNSAIQIPERMIKVFPYEVRSQIKIDFYSNIRMVMHQELYLSARLEKKRIALREYLVFTKEMREALINCSEEEEKSMLYEMVKNHGQLFADDAEKKFKEGWISEKDYHRALAGE